MDPITIAIGQAGTKMAVRLLLSGGKPHADDWSDAVTAVLNALFSSEADDASPKQLDIIESKIDALSSQAYDHAIATAKVLCRYALSPERTLDDRQGMLRDARLELVRALAAAGADQGRRAIVNWHLALVHYCLQAVEDSKACIRAAYGDALNCLADHAAAASLDATILAVRDEEFERRTRKIRGVIVDSSKMEFTKKGADIAESYRHERLAAAQECELLLGRITALQALSGPVEGVCEVRLRMPSEYENPQWARAYHPGNLAFFQEADLGPVYVPEIGLNISLQKIAGLDERILGYLVIDQVDRTTDQWFSLRLDVNESQGGRKSAAVGVNSPVEAIPVVPGLYGYLTWTLPVDWCSSDDDWLNIDGEGAGSGWVIFQSTSAPQGAEIDLIAQLLVVKPPVSDLTPIHQANWNHRIQWRAPNPFQACNQVR